jgi:hypothetical protein
MSPDYTIIKNLILRDSKKVNDDRKLDRRQSCFSPRHHHTCHGVVETSVHRVER